LLYAPLSSFCFFCSQFFFCPLTPGCELAIRAFELFQVLGDADDLRGLKGILPLENREKKKLLGDADDLRGLKGTLPLENIYIHTHTHTGANIYVYTQTGENIYIHRHTGARHTHTGAR